MIGTIIGDEDELIFVGILCTGLLLAAIGFWGNRYRQLAYTGGLLSFIGLTLLVFLKLNERHPSGPSPRAGCRNNIWQLSLALRYHNTTRGQLPPAHTTGPDKQPLHSWRTSLLPYIDRGDLFAQIRRDEPWTSEHNKKIISQTVEEFHCPSDANAGPYDTSYVAIIGPGTLWDPNEKNSLDRIRDGASQTILLIEMKNSGIAWAEPRDLDLENLPPGVTKDSLLESLSVHAGGFNAVFADGSVRFIPSDIPWDQFMALLTKAGKEKVDERWWN